MMCIDTTYIDVAYIDMVYIVMAHIAARRAQPPSGALSRASQQLAKQIYQALCLDWALFEGGLVQLWPM